MPARRGFDPPPSLPLPLPLPLSAGLALPLALPPLLLPLLSLRNSPVTDWMRPPDAVAAGLALPLLVPGPGEVAARLGS